MRIKMPPGIRVIPLGRPKRPLLPGKGTAETACLFDLMMYYDKVKIKHVDPNKYPPQNIPVWSAKNQKED